MFPEWLLLLVVGVRAGIYARISSDREGDQLGVTRQIEDCARLGGAAGLAGRGACMSTTTSAPGAASSGRSMSGCWMICDRGRIGGGLGLASRPAALGIRASWRRSSTCATSWASSLAV